MKKIICAIMMAGSINCYSADLVVGVENLDYLPFYSGKSRYYNGMCQELMDSFAKDNGHSFSYSPKKVTVLFDQFFSKQIDLKFPDNPMWKKDKRKGMSISYSEPVIITKVGVISTPGKTKAQVKKVGTVSGFTPWSILSDVKSKKISLVEDSRMAKLLKKLKSGEIDAIYGSLDVVKYHAKKVGGSYSFVGGYPVSEDKFHLSSIKSPQVITQFNSWLKSNSSKVKALKDKYLK